MQVSLENLGKLSRKMTVRIPADRVTSKVRERLAELGRTVRLKGFRPGKVPAKVIEQRFGQQVLSEAKSEVIGATFAEALDQEKLRPAMQPRVDAKDIEADSFEYVATFEVLPEIEKIDVSGLELERITSKVEEADVDRMIETLRAQRRQWTPVERPSRANDMVLIEYAATTTDGLRYPNIGRERIGTIIGSSALFPEFETKLTGLKTGDETEAQLAFPADFRVAELAGKSAKVELKVVRVQESELPALDEAFAAMFGVREGGLEQFRKDVRANLERELSQALVFRNKTAAVEKLVAANSQMDLPEGMVQTQARMIFEQTRQQIERAGGELANAGDPSQYVAAARQRVLASLLLGEIARQNQLKVDPRRVTEMLTSIAQTYEEPAQVVEMYSRDQELMAGLRSRVLEDQVVEWILDHAKVGEKALSFTEVMTPPSA